MLKNVYEGLNAQPKVYLSKEYFAKCTRLACLLSFASLFNVQFIPEDSLNMFILMSVFVLPPYLFLHFSHCQNILVWVH